MRQLPCCISHEFQRVALSHPEKIAVIHASGGVQLCRQLHGGGGDENFFTERAISAFPSMYDGDQCFTYSQLLASVDSLSSRLLAILRDPRLIAPTAPHRANDQLVKTGPVANELSEASVELDSSNIPKIIGIYMPPSVEYIIAVLSVLRCGGAFMPLDPAWPKKRILSVISTSKINLIIYSGSSFCEDGYHLTDGFRWLEQIRGCSTFSFTIEENSIREHNSAVDLVFPCEREKGRLFCYIMHTSGSTGKPKGICGTEQGIFHQ